MSTATEPMTDYPCLVYDIAIAGEPQLPTGPLRIVIPSPTPVDVDFAGIITRMCDKPAVEMDWRISSGPTPAIGRWIDGRFTVEEHIV